jgi:hypothetical protein
LTAIKKFWRERVTIVFPAAKQGHDRVARGLIPGTLRSSAWQRRPK